MQKKMTGCQLRNDCLRLLDAVVEVVNDYCLLVDIHQTWS